MRVLTAIAIAFFALAAMPETVQARAAEGCADLKLFPRLEGCVIVECSAKHHDSFDAGNGAPLDADTNALSYSCPAGNHDTTKPDLSKLEREFDALLRRAAFQNITKDDSDGTNPGLTARKGSQWVRWSANSEDDVATYSLTVASAAGEKFKTEACGQAPMVSPLKQCEVVECASKSEDSVAMRTALKAETALTGSVQTVTLACPSISPAQAFATVEDEWKKSGLEILFSDREHAESAWVTGRSGARWVELVSVPDGESVSYTLTVVPSAEVLTASSPAPQAAAPPAPKLKPAPNSIETVAVQGITPSVVATNPAPEIPTPFPPAQPSNAPPASVAPVGPGFVPPKPILRVPIEPTAERIHSVVGDVVINLLVDVGEDGAVTKAVLAGRITKDVLKLESAAIDAVTHWRFEPARQDGRIVRAAKIAVQMHFRGRPFRF